MGVVYYANYLHWFEIGRTEFIRQKGLAYRELEQRGLYLPVREAGCRYVQGAIYDEIVQIGTQVVAMSRASVTFGYEIRNEDQCRQLATGTTQLALVRDDGRPVPFPEDIKKILSQTAGI